MRSFLCLQVEVLTISGYLNLISMDFRWNWMKLQWWMEQMNSRFFYKIIIPLAMPQLAVIFLFSFIATYSEYVITSIFLQTPGKMTLALGLQSFISDQFAAHWTLFVAAAVISSLPIMIIFMCLQRFIQNGLVAGGVKG